jgi:hypothetical protein
MNEGTPIPTTSAKEWLSNQEARCHPGRGDHPALETVDR